MKIYLASSWRNHRQPIVLAALRAAGHQVYDFRHPEPGNDGFAWSQIDPEWKSWDPATYRSTLYTDQVVAEGFETDMTALKECDACVLLLPSGRSAHLEAGYAIGAKKPLFVLIEDRQEPELMYMMATRICLSVGEVLLELAQDEELGVQTYAYTIPGGAQICRACGCWDGHACEGGCHWVQADLCSACQAKGRG